jgi:hypothetical protein
MRTLPYVVVRIPRLSRTILIDDRIGEATFIFQGIIDLDIIRSQDKGWLETYHEAKRIIYEDNWGKQIIHFLTTNWDDIESRKWEKNIPTPRISLDRASLFFDAEQIEWHLSAFALAWGVSMAELSTKTPKPDTIVQLSNGMMMTWNTFLNNASQYLLGTKGWSKENPHRQAEALYRLCERAGVVRVKRIWW